MAFLTNQLSCDYSAARFNTIRLVEGFTSTVYYCTGGRVTIGYGYNIEQNHSALDKLLELFGCPNDKLDEIRTSILDIISKNKSITTQSGLQSLLDKKMEEFKKIYKSTTMRDNFRINSSDNTESVFEAIAPYFQTVTNNFLESCGINYFDNSREQLALFSMAYNNPSLLGPNLKAAIINGDRAEAWFEIRYNSNGNWTVQGADGIAKRRYFESDVFGLYSNWPTQDNNIYEYKQLFRMLNKHENQIINYDRRFGGQVSCATTDIANRLSTENRFISSVQSTTDEIVTAHDALKSMYVDEIVNATNQEIGTIGAGNPVLSAFSSYHLDGIYVAHETASYYPSEAPDRTVERIGPMNDLIFRFFAEFREGMID